jgi:hypothetical protein
VRAVDDDDAVVVRERDDQLAGEAAPSDTVERTEITRKDVEPSAFRNEAVGIKPQFGLIALDDLSGDGNTRAVGGVILEANLLGRAKTEGGKPYFGPAVGLLYSHLGSPGGDFFGTNSPSGNDRGTHLLILPINAKVGYTFSDVARLSLHGGATALYNNVSRQSAAAVGGPLSTSDSSWSARPNVGLDLEFGVGRNVGILLRPDWMFLDGRSAFTGTIGLDIPLT